MMREQNDREQPEGIDQVLSRIADDEVRALLIDLIHAIEASNGNQLALLRSKSHNLHS
ncbi:MAG: hypothetical protein MRY74_01645 [Neomegalonema sp.]|nr:hypothetical protein [Neomegalonema sp.]